MSDVFSPPAFLLYTADFKEATQEWTDDEVGRYIRLMMAEWELGSISPDPRRHSAGNLEAWETVKGKFKPTGPGGRLQNAKLEEVREEARQKYLKRSNAGKKGAEARYGSDDDSDASSNASSDANSPATLNHKPINHKPKEETITPKPEPADGGGVDLSGVNAALEGRPLVITKTAVLRILKNQVLDKHGPKALAYILDQMENYQDSKKVNHAGYVRATIENAPLAEIQRGERDSSGNPHRVYTYQEASQKAEKMRVVFSRYFAARLDSEGKKLQRDDQGGLLYFFYPDGDADKDPLRMKIKKNRKERTCAVSRYIADHLINYHGATKETFLPAPESEYGNSWFLADPDFVDKNKLADTIAELKRG